MCIRDRDILGKFAGRKDKYHVAKCMNIKEGYDAVIREVGKYDAVVLWDIHKMCIRDRSCTVSKKGRLSDS